MVGHDDTDDSVDISKVDTAINITVNPNHEQTIPEHEASVASVRGTSGPVSRILNSSKSLNRYV